MSASAWAYANGEIVPLEQARYWPNDLAIIYGEIVYEATRTFGGKPFKLTGTHRPALPLARATAAWTPA